MIPHQIAGYSESTTIVAEATPQGRGGISILRISGKDAFNIVSNLLDRDLPKPNRTTYAKLSNNNTLDSFIDDVMVSVYESPRSYTGEDVVEVSTHGNPILVNEALEALYKEGAHPAKPGEFTLRAFLNNRMDLIQAEAVSDLIASKSKEAARQARKQLDGGVGKTANQISDMMMNILSSCELELDFTEEDIILLNREEKLLIVERIINDLRRMISGYSKARNLRKGVSVAIVGSPNVGKSSLFNILANEEIAIVHHTPGTTRDVLEAVCEINGVHFTLYDTAGMRITPDEIEDEGVTRAIRKAESADMIISVSAPDIKDQIIVNMTRKTDIIEVINKSDLATERKEENATYICSTDGSGIEELKDELFRRVVKDEKQGQGTISRERHYNAVQCAIKAMKECREDIDQGQPEEIVAEQLREAVSAMDELTGKKRLDGLIEEIFSEFCIGK
ncbi:MAG: tRNA uridine-5-carboxymethylaminomethyl(34) synthesis GTPase MnmE [Calditrichaeota bacterium]|nr:tRNA uridine-5-carboxymethylaminomethyl(34) synthesis GTPase MnmE [Calditrichota bacterium]